MNLLRNIYVKLPVFKEVIEIRKALFSLKGTMDKHAIKEAQEYIQSNLLCQEKYSDPKKLSRYGFQVFSQNGEDGIIEEIFRRIGIKSSYFVEIGVGDGLENNTVFLLSRQWKGCWVDGNTKSIRSINKKFSKHIAQGQLKLLNTFVKVENTTAILKQLNVPTEFDLLSIDVDVNTFWIWAELADYKPRVVVVEYNALIPKNIEWKVDYDPDAVWDMSPYYGASLKSLEILGNKLGYALVGCDLTGVNAFFVRKDLCLDKFAEPFTSENHYEPPRYFLMGRGIFVAEETKLKSDNFLNKPQVEANGIDKFKSQILGKL